MKKITILTIGLLFSISAVFADSTNVGFKITNGELIASGTETTNLGAASIVTQREREADFSMASIFVEREVDIKGNFSMVIGLDLVPMTAEVAKLDGGTGFDTTIEVGNMFTLYVQPTFAINDSVSLFAKGGVIEADLDITDISRQATTAGTASTDAAQEKSLEGNMIGLGAQINNAFGTFDFIRLEATSTDFDQISHTNSNSKSLKADADMDLISLSIGKSF
jgi:hypothetical protein